MSNQFGQLGQADSHARAVLALLGPLSEITHRGMWEHSVFSSSFASETAKCALVFTLYRLLPTIYAIL